MKEKSLEQKVQRLLDYQEIQNVIAKHEYYYSAHKHFEELDAVWSKTREDISYGHNNGYNVGQESVRMYYGVNYEKAGMQSLEKMSELFPDIENVKENVGIGSLVVHPLTTPCIEVAGDGETAKGVWYSNGIAVNTGWDGIESVLWIWEKYGVDFVKENGAWKIWHFQGYTDMMVNLSENLANKINVPPEGPILGPQTFDKNIVMYNEYGPKTLPQLEPVPPEPYETWEDTAPYIK